MKKENVVARSALEPTCQLRWVEAANEDSERVICTNSSGDYFKLEQWWKDDKGGGEWKNIEIHIPGPLKTAIIS